MKFLVATALLAGASVLAQEAPPAATPDTPGENASSTPSDYSGPSILSRGGSASIGHAGPTFALRPFISLTGIYDSGLGNTTFDQNGKVQYGDGYGVMLSFGAAGTHRFKKSMIELDARGSARHYTQNSYYDGVDGSLSLRYQRRMTSRTSIILDENASRYQRAYSLGFSDYYNSGSGTNDPNYSGTAGNDLFDSPTYVLMTSARVIHERSARLSFSAGGSGFVVRRHSTALVGTNGYSANGDVAYRLTRYQTISIGYTFNHYDFQGRYGQSDMHGVNASYAIRMGRHWELAIIGGGFRVETDRQTFVLFDPEIAKLLGVNGTFLPFHQTTYMPRAGVHVTRTFRASTLTAGYDRTVMSGNGIYTTSGYESATTAYAMRFGRRVSVQTGANYSRYSALSQNLGRYRGYSAGVGFGYRLSHGLSMIGRIDGRRYYVASSSLNRNYYRAQLGFAWSPGDYPLSLW